MISLWIRALRIVLWQTFLPSTLRQGGEAARQLSLPASRDFLATYEGTDANLDGEDAAEEDLGVGADPARSLQHVVQQLPRHLSSRSCASCILWVNILCGNILSEYLCEYFVGEYFVWEYFE